MSISDYSAENLEATWNVVDQYFNFDEEEKSMIKINFDPDSEKIIHLLAKRSPQQTPEELIKYLLKAEIKRVCEFDKVVKEAIENLKGE